MADDSSRASPCINVCVIDQTSKICIGCGRTLTEIAAWGGLNLAARKDVMKLLPERMKGLTARGRERVLPSERRKIKSPLL